MKIKTLSVVAAYLVIVGTWAQHPSKKKRIEMRDAALSECRFKLMDPYDGRLTLTVSETPRLANYSAVINRNAKRPIEIWIRFGCKLANLETYLSRSMKMTDRGWSLDLSKEESSWGLNTTLYLLNGRTWQGAGTTQDDIDGDEERRTQYFGFCIPRGAWALCGEVSKVAYLNDKKSSVLPQVIQLLESIEFIDPPAGSTPQANSLSTQ